MSLKANLRIGELTRDITLNEQTGLQKYMFSINSAVKFSVVFVVLIFPRRVYLQVLLLNLSILFQSSFIMHYEIYKMSLKRKLFRYTSLYLTSLSFLSLFLFIGKLEIDEESDDLDSRYFYFGFLPDEEVNHSIGKV